ncbi:MAG: AAA family ATPase [Candidatus Diapherotrites archaeon]|uniref:AAA family ATPase n=1 Tax=Candidatus Iainarchaeum sp. TaxID=3101447 RepID=A0A8T3YQB4_9ARCH|nr:AAA family ATPase [Candidatus Diapherotrites archaeon]
MTVITSLRLKNFKSFRKAEISFAPGFTAIAGANASGKCVTGDTMVMLPSGKAAEIGKLVAERMNVASRKQFLEDGVIGFNDDDDFKVLSLNPETLKIGERKVAAVVQRLCPERLLKIRTVRGREITTTDYHPFFSVNQNGIYSLEAKDLKEGKHIATPHMTVNLEAMSGGTGKHAQKQKMLVRQADSDVFWDTIESIEEVKDKPKYVYDLSIDYTHNFVANGIFVHNSNILDALLFAMGITSLRLLRASKLIDLVNHDASEGYAKVELKLKDAGGRELEITRMIDRQGKSIYKLDGKRKTLNEIQALLLEIGVNPNGHNIVVQGDITRIIEMNAKQRREIIEEVAGLQEFQEKKEEALKKLEKVEQKVKDAHLVLNEREAYLQQLEKEREAALRCIALQDEAKRSKATIISEEMKTIRRELEAAQGSMERIRKGIEDKRAERNRLQDEERELEAKAGEATQRLIEAGEKTYSSFGRELEQRRGALALVNERLGARKDALGAKKEAAAELESGMKGQERLLAQKLEQLKEAESAMEKASEQLSEVSRHIDAKGPHHEERKRGMRQAESSHSALLKEVSGLKERLHEAAMQRHGLERDMKAAEHAMKDLSAEKEMLEEKLLRKKETERRLKALEARGLKERLEANEKGLERATSEMNQARGRLQSTEESAEALSRAKAECPVCEKPLEAGKKDRIAGKKAREMAGLKERIAALEQSCEAMLAERKRLQAEEKELSEALHSLKAFHEAGESLQKVNERIALHRETLASKRHEQLAKEEAALSAKVRELEKSLAAAEQALKEMRESEAESGMGSLLSKLQELNERKAERQNACTRLSAEIESLEARVSEAADEIRGCEEEVSAAEKAIEGMESERAASESAVRDAEAELEKASKANRLLEEEKDRLTRKISAISEKREQLSAAIESREKEMNELNLEQSRNEVRIVDLEEEYKEFSAVEPFKEFQLNELKKRIPAIEKEIEGLGAINMKSMENFDSFRKEVDDVREKAVKLDEERKAVVEMIDKIEVRKLNVFMDCFRHIAAKFSDLYYKFFEGEGQLDLSDKLNPLEGGLLIQAKYKEDTLKSIDAMSGGEKSLTALAFLFAIQSFHPAPFYIFDEVDAALDKDNSVKVGRMIKEQSGKSQFISISHNDSVINQADQIIGVALNRQKSSVIGLRLKRGHAAEEAAAQEAGAEGGEEGHGSEGPEQGASE